MTDLTEQWKKGELPSGWYYVQLQEGVYADNVKSIIMDYYTEFCDFMKHPYLIEQVLAPVPSYEEYLSLTYAKEEDEKIIAEYEAENEELKEILERHKKATAKAQIRSCDLEIINAQLKELLKECREVIKNVDTYYGNYDAANGYLVINKIDEALQ